MTKKIVVFKRKQLLFGLILAVIIIALAILLMVLTGGDNEEDNPVSLEDARYTPGLYTSDILLGDFTLHLELAVDRDCIKSINISNLDESVLAMYPLVESSLQSVSEQLLNGIDPDAVTLNEDSKFTQMLLIESIRSTLDKALLPEE